MKGALVAVLGHVDHGKTALVRALTGTDTDRLPEEKARGISIALGFARLPLPCGGGVDLVDAPGHERFVRAMVAGATAVQAAVLVVDAREGPRVQTREHAEIASLLGVRRGVVAVTRADLASPGERAAAAEGARALLAGLGAQGWPIVETSAATGEGIAELAAALGALARDATAGEAGAAWLPLDRAFVLPGAGVVVTGSLRRGRLARGDEVEVLPSGRRVTVRGLHVHGRPVEAVGPGRRVAAALRGVERGEVAAGDALASPGLLVASAVWDVHVEVLASAPRALAADERLRVLAGTTETGARLRPLGRGALEPGAVAVAQLVLDAPLAVPAREGFVLRLPSPPRTVGGGTVLDPGAPRRRGRDAGLLRAMAAVTPMGAAALRLRDAGPRGLPAAAAARVAGLAAPAFLDRAAEAEAVRPGTGPVLHRDALAGLEEAVLAAVEAAQRADPMGAGAEAGALLRGALPAGAPGTAVLARLVARGSLLLAAGRVRLRGLDAARLLSDADRALLAEVEAAFRAGGLTPPDAPAVAGRDPRRAQAIRALLARGVLVRAPDAVQKREIVFHADALARARAALRDHLSVRAGGATVSECGALLGVSRRYSVPLLERLDAEGFTRREGDRRRLAQPRGHPTG